MSVEEISKLEAMARQWDRCAANAPVSTYRLGTRADEYRGYAAACRVRAADLRFELDQMSHEDGAR